MTVSELETAVRYHNYLYFEKQSPIISDYDFDQLTRRLKESSPDSAVLEEIPSEGVDRPKVRHREPMLSLEKAYSAEEVLKWAQKFEGEMLASPKIDGLAIELRYDAQGQLELAATRGDGVQGDLITENARQVKDIPQQLPQGPAEIRGEVYMKLSIFRRQYQDQFANPRNLSAGAIKQKDPARTGDYQLSFFAYDVRGTGQATEQEKFAQLREWKLPIVETRFAERDKIEDDYQYFLAKRDQYDFETDGVVFRVNEVAEQERLGATAHHPRSSIAYKYQGDSGVTTLQDVEWNVARSRVITPIGLVAPVALSGAQVSRVSLHNYGFMKEKKLRQGAKVLMVRRGGVIPYLEAVQETGKGKQFRAPRKCPSCRSRTKIEDEFLYCTNEQGCTQTRIAELEHFIKAVEIDGFGPKLIERLYETALVTEPADFYDLTPEALLELERMGDTLAAKLIRNVQERRELNLAVFLNALGIRGVGKQVAKVIATRFGSFESIQRASEEALTEIDTVGPIIAHDLLAGLEQKQESIERLLAQVKLHRVKIVQSTGKLQGKSFCFTGQMSAMPRTEAEKKVEALGGQATNSVTKKLDYLVIGSEGGAGSKLKKAKKYAADGAKLSIIQEPEFLVLLE